MLYRLALTLAFYLAFSTFSAVGDQSPELAVAQHLSIDKPHVVVDPELEPFLRTFDQDVRRRKNRQGFPATTIAIVKDGQPVYLKALGVRSTKTGQAVDRNTVFRLASVSKGFAPMLAGIMVDRGLLDWDDRIIDHLPDFRLKDSLHAQTITVRHVLSMTTGLPRHAYSNLLDAGIPYPKIVRRLAEVKPAHAPGTFYNYQNVAYSLIGDVLEKVSGKSYAELLHEHLFEPLGMLDASADYASVAEHDNVALPHVATRRGYRPVRLSPRYYDVGPAAGVNASGADMVHWLQFLLGHKPGVLSPATLEEVFSPHVHSSLYDKVLIHWRGTVNRAHYAMGWRVMQRPEGDIVYHGGYVNGYRAEIALFREDDIGIAVLSNSTSPFISSCLPDFFEEYFSFRKQRLAEQQPGTKLAPALPGVQAD